MLADSDEDEEEEGGDGEGADGCTVVELLSSLLEQRPARGEITTRLIDDAIRHLVDAYETAIVSGERGGLSRARVQGRMHSQGDDDMEVEDSERLSPLSQRSARSRSHAATPRSAHRQVDGSDEEGDASDLERGSDGDGASQLASLSMTDRLKKVFGVEATQPPLTVDQAVTRHVLMTCELGNLCMRTPCSVHAGHSIFSPDTDEGLERRESLARCQQILAVARMHLNSEASLRSMADPQAYQSLSWEEMLLVQLRDDGIRNHQKVFFAMLDELASSLGGGPFRKYGDRCFIEKQTAEGVRTFAWDDHCSILEFIYRRVTPTINYHLWATMTGSDFGMANRIRDYLVDSEQERFPRLEFNRHLYSFRNGLFHSLYWTFFPWDHRDQWGEIAKAAEEWICSVEMPMRMQRAYDAIRPFKPPDHAKDASMCYIDIDFDQESLRAGEESRNLFDMNPTLIDCTDFLKVYETQAYTIESVQNVFYASGKMLYDVGHLEDGQTITFAYGRGGTGKSTLINTIKKLFHRRQYAVLANDMEAVFGWSAALEPGTNQTKKAVFFPETKDDCNARADRLQSMATADEGQTIAVKGKDPVHVEPWTAPIMMAGNNYPRARSWMDNGGQLFRRLLMFCYDKRVPNVDTELPLRIEANLDKFLARATLTYIQTARKMGTKNLWDCGFISPQVMEMREQVRNASQPLRSFILGSGKVKLKIGQDGKPDPSANILEDDFRSLFTEWCRSVNLGAILYSQENNAIIFEDFGIERQHGIVEINGEIANGYFLAGVCSSESDV